MAKERQRLKIDLEALFPGEEITIGDSSVTIRPLGLLQLSKISRQLKGFTKSLGDEGVTFDNYSEPKNILILAEVLLNQFPDILEEASNISIDDLNELPIEFIVEIIDVILTVNLKSKGTLEKNFKSLVGKFQVAQKIETPKKIKKK